MPRKSNLIRKHLQHNISRGRVSRNLVDIPPSYLVTIDNAQTLHRSCLVSDFGRCSFSAACCMLQFGLKCEGSVYWCSLRQGICMILPVSHVSTLNPCLHCLPCLPFPGLKPLRTLQISSVRKIGANITREWGDVSLGATAPSRLQRCGVMMDSRSPP